MPRALPIVNLHEAKFECTFGRGCEGLCCREGRPPVYPEEVDNIAAHLDRFLPLMRAGARAVVEKIRALRVGLPLSRAALSRALRRC